MWRCGRGSYGGVNPAPLFPLSVPCGVSALFPPFSPLSHRAAPMHLDIRRSRRVKVRKRLEWRSTHSSLRSPTHPNTRPLSPPAFNGGGEVIDFFSTLMRLLGLSLSLLQVGVKGLWGFSQEPTLRFSHRSANQWEKSHWQDPLGAVQQTACVRVLKLCLCSFIPQAFHFVPC